MKTQLTSLECHLSFAVCLMESIAQDELVAQFNRLSGRKLGARSRSPIEAMVDKACGYDPDDEDMKAFVEFVREYIWSRLRPEDLKDIAKKCIAACEI